ncbi:MAG: enoyl-CoA hydratase/isomerase family protein [Propionibacteriaceae bacterium]|jgi:enoyl-CoA hydratase|nr:enoyl-CoA hydratase/isomerase family protein [Propionibacteriaceae bacterium]
MSHVEFAVQGGVGRIVLNRPEAINALSLGMLHTIEDTVGGWLAAGAVDAIDISGVGERGYCAGADVRQLRDLLLQDEAAAVAFLRDEYRVDTLLATAPVPVVAHLDGIAMGGGLGLGQHGQRRLGGPGTRWAMPEVGIGLWPDVGVLHELSRLPGELGTHLALTGQTIDGAAALYAGLLDEAPGADPAASDLARDAAWIADCYTGDDPIAILGRLESHSQPRARAAAGLIRSRSPLSVVVALAAVRRAATLPDVAAVLAQDVRLAERFLVHSDVAEGIRAQLIDKDRRPRWACARVEDVPTSAVAALFD